jgi:hypothetical protein
MALMAAHGEIEPMPVAAIFADTGAEPESVYKWLEWLTTQLPFPVNKVWKQRKGQRLSLEVASLEMKLTKEGKPFTQTNIPFFTKNNENGEFGMIPHRSCTSDFKLGPLQKAQKILGEVKRGQKYVSVISWQGISTDEATRMRDSREAWAINRYPLIEKRMTRADCLQWMEIHHYPQPPRSACVFCPFHSDTEWRRLKNEEPEEFAKAVEFERAIQSTKSKSSNFKTTPYLHALRQPLDTIDFRNLEDRGQINMFENECEGMCGV